MKVQKSVVRYCALWLGFLLVSVGVWVAYTSVLQALPDLLGRLLRIDFNVDDDAAALWVLQQVLFVLLWWRAIKVFVLHGAPIPIGEVSQGLEHDGRSGRPVWQICIGNEDAFGQTYQGGFWYGAVFRAHPSSDKLMRSRLVLLILALPLGYMLLVHDSRMFIKKESHKGRAEIYRRVADRHSKFRDTTTPDAFRTEVARSLKKVAQLLEANRIVNVDGLKWTFYMGGGGSVRDHFGHTVRFSTHDGGKYTVKGLGPHSNGTKEAECVDDLKAIIQTNFESTWAGWKSQSA